jgi:hypothetical protein
MTPDQQAPFDPANPWRIEGPIDPQSVGDEYHGADALAFYLPFHHHREGWGIYILASGTLWLARVLKGSALVPGDERYLQLADQFLLEHERWHAYTEVACTRAELVVRSPLYGPYFTDQEAWRNEEAMANAHALLRCDVSDSRILDNLEAWLSRQGPGYSEYGRWTAPGGLSRGRNLAGSFMLRRQPAPSPPRSGSPHDFLYRGVHLYHFPTIRVDDLPSAHAIHRPFPKELGLQVIVHSSDHPPPHIHVHVVQDGYETKYHWPELVPLEKEPRLTRRHAAALHEYVSRYRHQIGSRVELVFGHLREA